MSRKIFIILSLMFPVLLVAQKAGVDFAASSKKYSSLPYFSADVKVVGYATKEDVTGSVIGEGMIRKSTNNYYSKFLTDEMLSNKNCMIIIDHLEKKMIYIKSGKQLKLLRSAKVEIPSMDTLLSQNDSVVYKGIVNGLKQYQLFDKGSQIAQTDIFFDASTLLLKKIVYYYSDTKTTVDAEDEDNEAQSEEFEAYKVEIDYNNIKTTAIDNSFFSENKFVQINKGKVQPVAAYSGYRMSLSQ